MSKEPSFDPFNLLPKPQSEPSPPWLPDYLRDPPPAQQSLPTEVLKQLEATMARQLPAPAKSLSERLSDHIVRGNRLISEQKVTKASATQWLAQLKTMLQTLFGNVSPYIKRLEALRKTAATTGEGIEQFSETVNTAATFAEILNFTSGSPSGSTISLPSRLPATRNVFIIHGHDELNARRLSDLLRDHDLLPIVMRSQPGMSRALTDKFEAEASKCSFAFAIFTPDDVVTSGTQQYLQARPNVIYETGWFVARLGKERVVLLLHVGAEMHTDLQGVSRIQFNEDLLHTTGEIQRELRAAKLIS
jgi:hypothetical protein